MPHPAEKQASAEVKVTEMNTAGTQAENSEEDEPQSVCVCMFSRRSWRERMKGIKKKVKLSNFNQYHLSAKSSSARCSVTDAHTHTKVMKG